MMKTGAVLRLLSVVLVFAISTFLYTYTTPIDISDAPYEVPVVNPVRVDYGDVDGDGAVTVADVRAVLKYVQQKENLDADALRSADADLDGAVTAADAAQILKRADISSAIGLFEQNGVQAVWVSTVDGDFPSKTGLSADELRAEIKDVIRTVKELGLNTIFLQVRANSDALYESDIFPTSACITGKQGDEMPFDVLEEFVKEAHNANVSLHAWVNPFRVSSNNDKGRLCEDNPAVQHASYTVAHVDADGKDAGVWYNPGLPEVRRVIVDGVMEIVKNYDVDGIHFDDYFYPYENAESFNDDAAYETYGNGLSVDDWRRQNINLLVQDVYQAIKSFKPEISFGISPFGIWAKQGADCPNGTSGLGNVLESYKDIYADTVTWIEQGWLDYVVPQLYWSVESENAPFVTLANWWADLCERTQTELLFGLAAYRGEQFNETELLCQLLVLEDTVSHDGVSYFSYQSLKNDLGNIRQVLAVYEEPAPVFDETVEVKDIGQAYLVKASRCDVMKQTEIEDDKYDPTDFYLGVTGMKVAVKQEVDELFYELENGLYVNKEDVVRLDGETLKQSVLGNAFWTVTARYTYLHIPTTEQGMCAVRLESKYALIKLYGVAGGLTADEMPTNPVFGSVGISVQDDTVTVKLNYLKANRILGYSAYYENGELIIRFMNPLIIRNDALPLEGYTISLDPGHSNTVGSEVRFDGKKYRENVLDYELALRVKEKLEVLGATVELTHNNERKKDLDTLIEEVRARQPDVNVSVHFNWLRTSTAHGTATWWCYENSRQLASSLQKKFCEITGLKNRGTSQGYYRVSRFCEFPSVLFETLYISTPDEFEWYITSDVHQDLVAEGIAQGILAFFKAQ